MDKKIITENPSITWIQVGRSFFKNYWYYTWLRLRRKIHRTLFKIGFKKISRDYINILLGQELERTAKENKSSLYIAHNLGALPFAVKAAELYNTKCGFDAEDYHRGEDHENSFHWRYATRLEDFYIPKLDYLSCSSPMIYQEYQKHYPNIRKLTVLNVFDPIISKESKSTEQVIKLFWFSQKIGFGRGLEDIIAALQFLPKKQFSLTLLGSIDAYTKKYFDELNSNQCDIIYIEPVASDEIFNLVSNFDIGLCLEPGRDKNNSIALSNKAFTYLSCGIALLLSDTPAQESFYKNHPEIGQLYNRGNINDLVKKLRNYIDCPKLIQQHKYSSRQLGQNVYNWNIEKKKLLNQIQNTI